MKIKKLIAGYLIALSLSGFGQQPTDKYNFDFENPIRGSSWWCIQDDFKVEMDSLNKISGKRSLLLSRTYLKTEFNLSIYQPILLPKTVKTVKASIFAENDQLFFAELKLIGLDKNRNLIASDSISIISTEKWQKFVTSINSNQGIDIIIIEIRAKETFKEKKKIVNLWVDNLSIILDGIDLYKYKEPKYQFSNSEYNGRFYNLNISISNKYVIFGY